MASTVHSLGLDVDPALVCGELVCGELVEPVEPVEPVESVEPIEPFEPIEPAEWVELSEGTVEEGKSEGEKLRGGGGLYTFGSVQTETALSTGPYSQSALDTVSRVVKVSVVEE